MCSMGNVDVQKWQMNVRRTVTGMDVFLTSQLYLPKGQETVINFAYTYKMPSMYSNVKVNTFLSTRLTAAK